MRFILPILVVVVLLLFPQRVYCAEYIEVNFIQFDECGNHRLEYLKIPPEPQAHVTARANAALTYLFALDKPNTFPYPEDTHVLSIRLTECHLTVSLYIPQGSFGGSMLERIYLGQILKTLLNLDGVSKVSIIADTPEGLNVREKSAWAELFHGIIPTLPFFAKK